MIFTGARSSSRSGYGLQSRGNIPASTIRTPNLDGATLLMGQSLLLIFRGEDDAFSHSFEVAP